MNHNLAQLILDLRSGKQDLLAYLEEVAYHFGQREPDVLAFMPEDGRFSRLKREALALLEKYPDPDQRPPLFGVLVGVKDIFRVDGFATSAGSKFPTAEFEGDEAPCVTVLKEVGALILGKTVTTEFAYLAPVRRTIRIAAAIHLAGAVAARPRQSVRDSLR